MAKKSLKNKVLWITAFVCFFFFLIGSQIIFSSQIEKIDNGVYCFVNDHIIKEQITPIMKCFTWLSSPICLFAVFLLFSFIFKKKKEKIALFLNLIGVGSLNQIFKIILKRPRPNIYQLIPITGYSFPSAHAMVSLSFYGFITYLLVKKVQKKQKQKAIILTTSLLILGIGFSRIYLGVHYFSDVLAGFLISLCYLSLFIKAYNNFGKSKNRIKFLNSFKYAFTGIFSAFKSERNMKIHIIIMCFVILFGFMLKISITEWFICILCFALVISGEMFNTAIEEVVDLITEEENHKAKLAKDIAAGAVLVLAIASLFIGIIIFFPKILVLLT